MNSPQFIETKLVNRTNAGASRFEAKNNRYHFHLSFTESIGWDWVYGQVKKSSSELDANLEIWEIHPRPAGAFDLEVRETERRPNIDESQRGLTDFETE